MRQSQRSGLFLCSFLHLLYHFQNLAFALPFPSGVVGASLSPTGSSDGPGSRAFKLLLLPFLLRKLPNITPHHLQHCGSQPSASLSDCEHDFTTRFLYRTLNVPLIIFVIIADPEPISVDT